MALTSCKKCSKLFDANARSCPYCGTPVAAPENAKSLQQTIKNLGFVLFMLFAISLLFELNTARKSDSASSAPVTDCQTTNCAADSLAVTDSANQSPYYTCKSRELSNYSNYVLQLMFAHAQISGLPPKSAPKTGEPDVQGEEKRMLDQYRAAAGVNTFEEALAKCYKGFGGTKVVVLYNPDNNDSIYVASETDQEEKFWLPKSRLLKR